MIGLLRNVQENGAVAFVPLETLQAVLRTPAAVNAYWVSTDSLDHAAIDATTTRVEDALSAHGRRWRPRSPTSAERDDVAADRDLGTTITVPVPDVAVSIVGLVSAITMNVLERTREIGILRCIGARGRDIRAHLRRPRA